MQAYLNRGKCAYLIGDTGLAFMDFQKIIILEPKNPMVHVYAGNLLMTTGSYEDATKAFTNADNIHKSPLALYQRSRCFVALTKMKDALKDLNRVIEISPHDKVAHADRECLVALQLGSSAGKAAPGVSGEDASAHYEKAVVALTKLISQEKSELIMKQNHNSSIVHNHSQIIPSAAKTKTDKIRAIKRKKEKKGKDKAHEEEEDDEYSDVDLEDLEEQQESLEAEANYYKENIFNKEDYYLYRAVMYFYAGEHEKALTDFEQSSAIMHSTKVLTPNANVENEAARGPVRDNLEELSQASSQTD